MSDEEFDFDKMDKLFNDAAVAMEEMAKFIVPMYIAFRKQGLSVQEASALTAATVSQMMPIIPPQPQEGS